MKRTSKRNERRQTCGEKNTFKAKTFCTQRNPCFKNIPQNPKSKITKIRGKEAVAKLGKTQTLPKT